MNIIIKERKIEKYTKFPKVPFGIKIKKIGGDIIYGIIVKGKCNDYFLFTDNVLLMKEEDILYNLNKSFYEIVDFEITFYEDVE